MSNQRITIIEKDGCDRLVAISNVRGSDTVLMCSESKSNPTSERVLVEIPVELLQAVGEHFVKISQSWED